MNNMEQYRLKMGKISKILDYIINLVHSDHQKIENDDRRHQKNID